MTSHFLALVSNFSHAGGFFLGNFFGWEKSLLLGIWVKTCFGLIGGSISGLAFDNTSRGPGFNSHFAQDFIIKFCYSGLNGGQSKSGKAAVKGNSFTEIEQRANTVI